MSDEPITPTSKNLKPSNKVRCAFAAMILLCLLLFLSVVAFRAALGITPYELQDSQGRTMGFNDVFSREHYGFIFDRVSVSGTISYLNAYDWFFLATLLTGLWLVWKAQRRTLLIYHCVQLFIFPLGYFGFVMLPMSCFELINDLATNKLPRWDREGFIDVPFVPIVGHAPWLLCSILMILVLWRSNSQR